MNTEYAETIALNALGFIASDADRLSRFLSLTGYDKSELIQMAQSPEALGGLLDYVLSNEDLLLDFAEQHALHPEEPARARRVLPGFAPMD